MTLKLRPFGLKSMGLRSFGIYTHVKHTSFTKCRRILAVRVPFMGFKDVYSWDSSKKEALATQHITLDAYLERSPSCWD